MVAGTAREGNSGPAPVFTGFGSMAPAEGERLGELIATTVARAGVRAVVQAGWAGLAPAGPVALAVGELPHEWLLPRMAAVGSPRQVGITGAGLRAGYPRSHGGIRPPPVPGRLRSA